MIKVEAFYSPGCAKCAQAKDMLKAIIDELSRSQRVFEVIGGIALILSGLYMLNAYFFLIPALAA